MPSHADTRSARVAETALFLALGACLGYAEAVMLPSLPIPGVRLGLANLAVVLALALRGAVCAGIVSVGRVVLVALATGAFAGPTFLLSLSGAVAAWSIMTALHSRGDTFSPVGWSLAGSAAHVTAQLVVASVLVGSSVPLALLPPLLGASVPTGLAIGYSARLLVSRLPRTVLVLGR